METESRMYPKSNLSPEQLLKIDSVREEFARVEANIEAGLPPGRYRSLALTSLEESCMWAVKAVTHAEG